MSFALIIIIVVIIAIILCIVFLKQVLIFFVRVYQFVAPKSIRNRCVFTPSCSEYMILSIKKYGVVEGVKKGIDRLNRCHWPNRGEDYP